METPVKCPQCSHSFAVPEEKDMVLVPRELTAENGMKLALSGEFIVRPDTESDFEYIVPWDTIKEIHRRIVATSSPLAPCTENPDQCVHGDCRMNRKCMNPPHSPLAANFKEKP